MRNKRHESLGRWISMLYRYRDIYFERELKPYNIGPSQLRILLALHRALDRNKEITQTDIAHHLRLDKGAMAKSVKKLEREGFIIRQRSAEDNREYRITLTEKTLENIRKLRNIRRRWTGILEQRLTKKEKNAALGFFQRMAENADAFLNK